MLFNDYFATSASPSIGRALSESATGAPTSTFAGVQWSRGRRQWCASTFQRRSSDARSHKRARFLGYFDDESHAAAAVASSASGVKHVEHSECGSSVSTSSLAASVAAHATIASMTAPVPKTKK